LTHHLNKVTMGDVAGLIIFIVCILVFLALVFWYGSRGEQNEDPALGTNRPYPDGVGPTGAGSDAPPYLPDFTISEAETFRRGADRRLTRLFHQPRLKVRSWMDEPGALEAAGLVDASPPPAEPIVAPKATLRRHRRKKHH
jgi:hypothetical protein